MRKITQQEADKWMGLAQGRGLVNDKRENWPSAASRSRRPRTGNCG